jgi:sugar-specific transcriptional regulator TrmB
MINYQELKKIGLSDKEAKIYLASLTRGPETAPTLAKLADIVRPTAYVIIEGLVNKGLMSSVLQDKKTLYNAESPEHILSLLHLQKSELEEKEREFKKLLPGLEAMANIKGDKPKVRVFEGRAGLQATSEHISKIKTKQIYSFIPLDDLYGLFSEKELSETLTQKRVSKKTKSKVLYTSKKGTVLTRSSKELLREARHIPANKFPFDCGIDIYDDVIALYTFKGKLMGIIIENQDMASTLKSIFEICWDKYK